MLSDLMGEMPNTDWKLAVLNHAETPYFASISVISHAKIYVDISCNGHSSAIIGKEPETIYTTKVQTSYSYSFRHQVFSILFLKLF